MTFDIFKKLDKGMAYTIGLVLSLVSMVLLPNIASIGYMLFISTNDPGNFGSLMDPNSEFYKVMMGQGLFVVQTIGYIGAVGIFLIIFSSVYKQDLIDFKKDWKKNILIIIFSFALMYLLTVGVGKLFEIFNIPTTSTNQSQIEDAIHSDVLMYVAIMVVFLAPFIEETIFRTMLVGTIEKKLKWHWIIAVIVSTIIFSGIHISTELELFFADPKNAIYLLSILLYVPLALVLTLSYHFSKNNFWVVFVIHLLNNLLSLINILV